LRNAGVPPGVILSFNRDSSSSSYTSTINIAASTAAQPGSYAITISGVTPVAQHTFTFVLIIKPMILSFVVESAPGNGGITTPSSGSYAVPTSSTFAIAEKPADGWVFQQWILNGVGAGNSSSILVRGTNDTVVIALFEPAARPHQEPPSSYQTTISALGVDAAQAYIDGVAYKLPVSFNWPLGSVHVVSAPPEIVVTRYGKAIFGGWTGTLGSPKSMVSFTVDGTTSLAANYVTRYPVQLHFVDQSGSSINPGNVTLASAKGLVLVPPSGRLWLANATYSLISANWKGSELIGTGGYPQLKISGPLDTVIKLPVYNIQVHVQDIFGNPLSGAKVSILLPDGKTTTETSGTDGVTQFLQIPQGPLELSTLYLGVTSRFSVDAAQAQTLSVTVALSYPVYALIGVVGGTIAIAFAKLRRRTALAF
jgi:hypothetical protein